MTTYKTPTTEYSFSVGETGVDIHWQGETLTIDSSDLVQGGWEFEPTCDRDHCSNGDCPACMYCDGDGNLPTGGEALKRWHDEQGHHGPLWLCYEEPCKSVGEAIGARG